MECNWRRIKMAVSKKFWASKTFWGAALVVLGGALGAAGYPSEFLMALGAGLGLVGVRDCGKAG